jgi:hypothetical protein
MCSSGHSYINDCSNNVIKGHCCAVPFLLKNATDGQADIEGPIWRSSLTLESEEHLKMKSVELLNHFHALYQAFSP